MADKQAVQATTGSITTMLCLSVALGDADRRQVEALCAEVNRLRARVAKLEALVEDLSPDAG